MGKMIDVTGQKFGRLTACYPTRVNGRFGWHCICDCGTECDVDSSNLRSGKQQSCGCLRRESGQNRKKDLTGQKFGKLTVLESTKERQGGAIMWRCLCDCGMETLVSTGNLTSGHTSSCGCKQHISVPRISSLTGQRFGKLVVLERIPGGQGKRVKWKCQCDCGNIVEIPQDSLTREEYTQSCGCINSKGEEKISKILRDNNISFKYQHKFVDCVYPTGHQAIFDFYVNDQYIIEYDGIQHYEIIGWNDEANFKLNQSRDAFKNAWCKEHNIPLIRIPYIQYKELSLQDLLLEGSKFLWRQDEEIQQKS